VIVYSNCDTVELVLNGKSLGAKALAFPREGTKGGWNTYERPDRNNPTTADLHLSWDVAYAPGKLQVIGRRQGAVVAQQELVTAGDARALKVSVDNKALAPDGVAHVDVAVVDANGNVVPDASTPLTFEVTGAARLLATDNGDPADHVLFQSRDRNTFHGLALGLVRAGREAGTAKVTVHAAGLPDAGVVIEVRGGP